MRQMKTTQRARCDDSGRFGLIAAYEYFDKVC